MNIDKKVKPKYLIEYGEINNVSDEQG